MADTKISALDALTTPADTDLVEIVDVSDTSMGASGTNKRITKADLVAADWTVATVTAAGTAAANKTIIDAALAARAAAGGGIVWLPSVDFQTNGGHDVSAGVEVWGVGSGTRIYHRGATYCFRLMAEASGSQAGALRHMEIHGSSASLAAVAGGIGVELSNGQRHTLENVWVYGFTAAGSIGIYYHVVAGTLDYVEQSLVFDSAVINCKTLVRFFSEVGATASFGYTRLIDAQLMIYADQTAVSVGTGTLYNARLVGSLHYTGNNGIGFDVDSTGIVWQGTKLDVAGEMLGAFTGCTRIRNDNVFEASGRFYINGPQPPDNLTGVTTHDFVEDTRTWAEMGEGANFDIASAATIAIPAGSEFFNITGTTNITTVTASWEGRRVTLKFAGVLTVTDGSNLKLAGNFVTSADDTLTLICRSGIWYETGRSAN